MLTLEQPPTFDEAEAAQRLAPMWNEADMISAYPVPESRLVELLRACGYDASRLVLADLRAMGRMPADAGHDPKNRRYTAAATLAIVALLESRRMWLAGSVHDAKKSHAWRGWDQAKAAGMDLFPDLEGFDARDVGIFLAETDNRQLRESLLVALLCMLEGS